MIFHYTLHLVSTSLLMTQYNNERQKYSLTVKKVDDELCIIDYWIKSNRLFLNYSKSTCFIVTTKHKMNTVNQISIQIEPNKFISSNSTKYLGIFIDSDLKWHNHVKYCTYFINLLFQLESYLLSGIMLINLHSLKFTTALYILTLSMKL